MTPKKISMQVVNEEETLTNELNYFYCTTRIPEMLGCFYFYFLFE